MRRTPVAPLALVAFFLALAWAPASGAQTSPPATDVTEAVVSLESEVLALVELGALRPPVPPELQRIHDTWKSSLDGLDHDALVGWVIDADDRGSAELDRLRATGVAITPAIDRSLGALRDEDVDALRVGRPIGIGAGEYRAALGNLDALAPATSGPAPSSDTATADALANPAAVDGATASSTAWWVWVLIALGASLGFSMLIGRVLKGSAAAYPSAEAQFDRGDEVPRLLEAARRLSGPLAAGAVAQVAVDEAVALTQARHAAFVTTSGATAGVTVAAEHPATRIDPTWLGAGAIGRVLATGQPERGVLVDDAFGPEPSSLVVVPVLRAGRLVGALCVDREPTRPFPGEAQEVLSRLAPLVAGALDAAERHDGVTSMSLTDGLTSLANRRRLDRDLPAALGRGHGSVGFLMIDVDHFKTYNDANGHVAGDDALRLVAEVLASQVRPTDVVYRWGGEEFCVLLADATPEEAALVAERIRSGVEAVDFPGAGSQPGGRMTVSVGLAVAEASNPLEITQRADEALYAAKHGGRNRVAVSPAAP